jgi:hypothetical protein
VISGTGTFGVATSAALEQARQQVFEAYCGDVHFTGCAIGFRQRGGVQTDEPVVVAMVAKKLPAGAISRSRLLPRTVQAHGKQWGVDVVEVGPLRLARGPAPDLKPAAHGPITGTFRPLVQGCSISDLSGPSPDTGTLGCMVRDTTDATVCVLSSSSVLSQDGLVSAGQSVIQPGTADGGTSSAEVATLKRFVKTRPRGINRADVAIAQPLKGIGYSQQVAKDLMKPISAAHPAVGMCVASDEFGLNCFLAPMETSLKAIKAQLLPATAHSPCTVPATVGMHLEKVSRTSGYTSSTVAATGAQVKVGDPITGGTSVFGDMIWTQGLFYAGDSGAVACEGGNGRTFVPPPIIVFDCLVLENVGHYFKLPLGKDNRLTTRLQDQFLAKSIVGNLIIGLVYDNTDTIVKRVHGKQAPSAEQALAATYYHKYKRLLTAMLAHPDSTKELIGKGNLDDFEFILSGLSGAGGPALLTKAETAALQTIYKEVLVHAKGLDYHRLVSYMNERAVFDKVVRALKKVPSISLYGTLDVDVLKPGG